MATQKLPITPNVPVQVALKFPQGKIVEGRFGDQVYFSLSSPPDHCLYLDLGPAEKVNALGPAPNQPFWLCKRWTGKKSDSPVWDVWPVVAGEQQPGPRAVPSPAAQATGIDDTDLERKLRASLEEIERNKRERAAASVVAPATVAEALPAKTPATPSTSTSNGSTNGHGGNGNGNGSNGNGNGSNGAPKPYAAAGIAAPPTKLPIDVAFCEVLDWMGAALRERNEQWTDQARQDFVSTVLISAQREGWVTLWRRGGAA